MVVLRIGCFFVEIIVRLPEMRPALVRGLGGVLGVCDEGAGRARAHRPREARPRKAHAVRAPTLCERPGCAHPEEKFMKK